MHYFRNFTVPLWEIFAGNLLFLICSLFYLAWWVTSFRPGSTGGSLSGLFILMASITGFAALALISIGLGSSDPGSRGLPVKYILMGGVALFFILLPITTLVFHRIVTSELIIIHIWAIIELCAVAVVFNSGRFGLGTMILLTSLVGMATLTGLVCYLVYYRLDAVMSYWVGMIPLIADALVMMVFLGLLALS